jgi:hypothetical protein
MLRKLVQHSNIICVTLTGLAWIATLVVRFWLLKQQLPPGDWILWVVSNNFMIAGFAYQLGVISFRKERDDDEHRWWRRWWDVLRPKAKQEKV